MNAKKLYIAMVGLPAMGKSTIANRLRGNLRKDGIRSRIFNNGDLRRKLATRDTSYPEFYDPENAEGVSLREKIAKANIERARRYLGKGGQVAILDATNVSLKRRETIAGLLRDHPILFVECFHQDDDILEASIERKIALPEFRHLGREAARESFKKRIKYYENIYAPLKKGRNFIRLDSLYNRIRQEELTDSLPYYEQVRDFIVTDTVRNLFLIRHGETYFNLENRIGGDSKLTGKGVSQARALAVHFRKRRIPVIFTSRKMRTVQTAEPIAAMQKDADIIPLAEFDEINSGGCECMSYEEKKKKKPEVYLAR
ncbi:MAG: histidine phosphatase family protein, partial [Deltaproteobacteria bacterium]|nr:histidine phosphatase family protein [Deltaproteobacteria bacterium]